MAGWSRGWLRVLTVLQRDRAFSSKGGRLGRCALYNYRKVAPPPYFSSPLRSPPPPTVIPSPPPNSHPTQRRRHSLRCTALEQQLPCVCQRAAAPVLLRLPGSPPVRLEAWKLGDICHGPPANHGSGTYASKLLFQTFSPPPPSKLLCLCAHIRHAKVGLNLVVKLYFCPLMSSGFPSRRGLTSNRRRLENWH